MAVLVTGGAGYIGTHVLASLTQAGYDCVSVDNYSNSTPDALGRVGRIAQGRLVAYDADIRDPQRINEILAKHPVESVIHLAGLKSVAESVLHPDVYEDNNVQGTAALLDALQGTGARLFVFSSSATVYGASGRIPYDEDSPTVPINPYGRTKLAVEGMLQELARTDPRWRVANLRYFNPVGAHPSGLIGENPRGRPNNLMPFVCQVAAGLRERLEIFGTDYPTHDGTGVRDYIHVMDLALGHVSALRALAKGPEGTVLTLNLGTGRGHSVLEVVETFERVNSVPVPRAFAPRRDGDLASYYADSTRAEKVLGWKARRGLEEMCRDAWRWQRKLGSGPSQQKRRPG